jgi:hypothetical protein
LFDHNIYFQISVANRILFQFLILIGALAIASAAPGKSQMRDANYHVATDNQIVMRGTDGSIK